MIRLVFIAGQVSSDEHNNVVAPGDYLLQYRHIMDNLTALLAAGTNCEAVDNDGWRPLHHAALYSHLETIAALLAAGGFRAVDADGEEPLAQAFSSSSQFKSES